MGHWIVRKTKLDGGGGGVGGYNTNKKSDVAVQTVIDLNMEDIHSAKHRSDTGESGTIT